MKLPNFLTSLFRSSVQGPRPLKDPVLVQYFGSGSNSGSGMSVTPDTAMSHDAVYGCVRVLAETMAQLPLHVYERTDDDGKQRATDHPLYPILHDMPNRMQTSFEWREMMTGHTALRGDSFSEIVSDNAGRVVEIIPLHPDRCRPFVHNGEVVMEYLPEMGQRRILLADEILRLPGMSFNGINGMSPISAHRETIGKGLAANEYGGRFFGNNAVPKGALKVPAALDDEAALKLRESWNRRHRGVENSQQIAIFDAGLEWQEIGMSHEDAQYIETMKFNVEQIARIYRVPLVLLQSTEKATSWGTGIEQFMLAFVVHTIMPWSIRWEQRLNASLLSDVDRRKYFIAFDLKGLLRGDAAARKELYKALWGMGAINADEIRRAEDMNAIPNNGGSQYFVPMNMVPADKALDILLKSGPKAEPKSDDEPKEPAVRLIK